MNINELDELAKAAPAAFYLDSYDGLDREFNGIDSFSCGRNGGVPLYAFDQSEIRELIAAYRESIFCLAFANSKLKDIYSDTEGDVFNSLRIYASLAVAKRLGVE